MRTRAPDFFVVGAPKCGTTAMYAYLRQHPQVFLPAQKELHYYGSDLHGLPTTLRPDQHEALFGGAGDADRVGVTAIWALYSREAAREIKVAHPRAGIVIMLRDPVEMMYALHSEHLYQAIEDIGSFPMALEAEAGRLSGRSPLPACRARSERPSRTASRGATPSGIGNVSGEWCQISLEETVLVTGELNGLGPVEALR